MSEKLKEVIVIATLAFLVVTGLVGMMVYCLILCGQAERIMELLLGSQAEGEVSGVAFALTGPIAMWLIIFIIMLKASRGMRRSHPVKLMLKFRDRVGGPIPPQDFNDFQHAECWYDVRNQGKTIKNKCEAIIQYDQRLQRGYIWVKPRGFNDEEFTVQLQYNGKLWVCDGYSPRSGEVELE